VARGIARIEQRTMQKLGVSSGEDKMKKLEEIVAYEGCKKKLSEVQICQIRIVNFQVWNDKCYRELTIPSSF
jgi:hypothetical protein